MGKIHFRLEDRLPAWWEMAGAISEILAARDPEFPQRDLYLERLLDEIHYQGNSCDNAENRDGD